MKDYICHQIYLRQEEMEIQSEGNNKIKRQDHNDSIQWRKEFNFSSIQKNRPIRMYQTHVQAQHSVIAVISFHVNGSLRFSDHLVCTCQVESEK